jgi:hypothetical protein
MQLGYKVSKYIITESRKKNRLYEKKWLRSNFLQEYFEGINVIITTNP